MKEDDNPKGFTSTGGVAQHTCSLVFSELLRLGVSTTHMTRTPKKRFCAAMHVFCVTGALLPQTSGGSVGTLTLGLPRVARSPLRGAYFSFHGAVVSLPRRTRFSNLLRLENVDEGLSSKMAEIGRSVNLRRDISIHFPHSSSR